MLLAIVSCSKPIDNGNALWLPEGTPEVNAEVVLDDKINFAKIAIYRKISHIFEYYMSPDMSPAKDREPCCYKGF